MAEIMCCEFCGRDTKNKSGVCKVCLKSADQHGKDVEETEDLYGEEFDSVDDTVFDAMTDATE